MIPQFEIATLFVDMCQAVTDESIIGRAQRAGKINVRYWNIRDYAGNKHNRVDDATYGGGKGMLMQAAPIYRCWEAVCEALGEKPYVVFPSPQGKLFTQAKAVELAKRPKLMFLCGHYEGVDQRVLDAIVDEELSLGDFVLTGGEIPAGRSGPTLSRRPQRRKLLYRGEPVQWPVGVPPVQPPGGMERRGGPSGAAHRPPRQHRQVAAGAVPAGDLPKAPRTAGDRPPHQGGPGLSGPAPGRERDENF